MKRNQDILQFIKDHPTSGPSDYADATGISVMAAVVAYRRATMGGLVRKIPATYKITKKGRQASKAD